MKIRRSCLLIFSIVVLSGCMSMPSYREASRRHHEYTSGQKHAATAEWHALISDFQEVIDADVQGALADDAQYAIASSWVWSIKTGDTEAPQQAIKAFQKLIRTYPNSQYVPQAHYWLGHCYDHIGAPYQAITQYQIVESRYADSKVSEPAQLALARAYARQSYVTRAETLYNNLIKSSTNQVIIATAAAELQTLKPQQKPVNPFLRSRVQTQTQTQARISTKAQSKPRLQPKPKPKSKPKPEPIKPEPKTEPQRPASRPDPEGLDPESLTREFGLTAKTIVIDPGHGGKDPGALGRGAVREKTIVLSISEKLREILTKKGYTVLMTRDTNRFIPLRERTAFATQHKADLFLSIHANASRNLKAKGIETYYLDVTSTDKTSEAIASRENADSGYSIQELETLLKGIIQESKSEDSKRLAGHIQQALIKTTGAVDRGVKNARFVVLIGTSVPAVLIETGFVSNPTEGRKLMTPVYQRKIATAIVEGIEKFLGKTDGTPLVKSSNPKLAVKGVERSQ